MPEPLSGGGGGEARWGRGGLFPLQRFDLGVDDESRSFGRDCGERDWFRNNASLRARLELRPPLPGRCVDDEGVSQPEPTLSASSVTQLGRLGSEELGGGNHRLSS